MTLAQPSQRLDVVDALRGFALAAIALLHNLEHFDFYFVPEYLPDWLKQVDQGVWIVMFLLFAGKSYSIFALLFGLTFFIQSDNQARKGRDFKGRFLWRLMLLFAFGLINTMFYQGDILKTYAVIGIVLIPASLLPNRWLFALAIFCLLQPIEWMQLLQGLQHPVSKLPDPASWAMFGKMAAYITGNSFADTVAGNLGNGAKAVMHWTWESGRITQTAGLFMLGLLAGRTGMFHSVDTHRRTWKRILEVASIGYIPLYAASLHLPTLATNAAVQRPLQTLLTMWANLAFTAVLVAGFVLLFRRSGWRKAQMQLAPLGRMSLSNYVLQSILGSLIYYGYGLGLYAHTGASYSLLIGICLVTLQVLLSRWWLRTHAQGPLENLWHRLTWL